MLDARTREMGLQAEAPRSKERISCFTKEGKRKMNDEKSGEGDGDCSLKNVNPTEEGLFICTGVHIKIRKIFSVIIVC